jgi:hypothetical protein
MRPSQAACSAWLFLATLQLPGQGSTAPEPVLSSKISAADWEPTKDLKTQLARDVTFFNATLFPDLSRQNVLVNAAAHDKPPKKGILELEDLKQSSQISWILGRLFVAMAFGGLKYCTAPNAVTELKDWPLSLATALSHGQRVDFALHGANAGDLYALLVTGSVQKNFQDPYPRSAASHGFQWQDGKLQELKYKGLNLVYAVTDGLLGRHHGVDVAFGGLGNTRWDGFIVGPKGTALDPARAYQPVDNRQQGHLFMHHVVHGKAGPDQEGGLMVGLETSAPGAKNMYGVVHDASSARKDPTLNPSVNGGQKMQKLLLTDAPAEIGGLWVNLTGTNFADLQAAIWAVDHMDPKNAPYPGPRMVFLAKLLAKSGPEASSFLRETLKGIKAKPAI